MVPSLTPIIRFSLLKLFLLFLILTTILPLSVSAEYISLPLVSGGFSWQASTDGENWIPAYPEYPNGLTIPYPSTTEGVFMWYWDPADGFPSGTNGPNTVYFQSTFMITDLHDKSVGAWVAVDDWMELSVNGTSVATYQLELNFDEHNQPILLFVDFTEYINTRYQGDLTGYNTITIEAHDGGPDAFSRSHEWLFFDAFNVNSTPILNRPSDIDVVANVPEPDIFKLLGIGLVILIIKTVRFTTTTKNDVNNIK
jgi:hypothetical protein